MSEDQRPLPDWLNVSRETQAKLSAFLDMVEKWNPRINLVSASSLPTAWTRHVLDSAQLWSLRPTSQGVWLDIGSGGGFPGIVMAILAQAEAPDLQVKLVESDRRKSVFLSEAVRQLHLNATVHPVRIETLAAANAQIVSARALSALNGLMPMVAQHLAPGGTALFPKGQRYQAELADCAPHWTMTTEVVPSKIDPDGVVIKISDLRHV